MMEHVRNVRHVLTCPHKDCLLCKVLPYEWERRTRSWWIGYIFLAWVMLEYALLHP